MSQLHHNLATHPADDTVIRQADVAFECFKRTIDVAGALVGLVLVSPILLVCAICIKLADGGPVFYHQWRVGKDGWLFKILKLRTMGLAAERHGVQFAQRNDPRVLTGCAWMRKSHVDELPQLWNILVGQMSLVGPRPERPEMFESLRPFLPRMEERLSGPPGLTGLAQLRNGYSNDIKGVKRKLTYDLFYLRRRSILTELRLIALTLPKFWDRSAN